MVHQAEAIEGRGPLVESLNHRGIGLEKRHLGIGVTKAAPMALRPGRSDLRLIYILLEPPFAFDGNGKPAAALWRLDLVAIVPMPFGELNIVENDVLIDLTDEIKETAPGNIARLDDGDSLHEWKLIP